MSATKLTFSLLLSTFLSLSARGATFAVPVQEGDHLVVKGLAAQIQFTAQPGATQLQVSGLDEVSQPGRYSLTKHEHDIELKMAEYEDKQAWKKALANPGALRKIEVFGPPVPVEVHLQRGQVTFNHWTKEARVEIVQGRASSQSGSGSLQIHLQKGDIMVSDHSGKVSTDGYNGNTGLKNIHGDIDSQLFSGNLVIERAKGYLNVDARQANTKISQSSGSLQFENGKGNLTVQSYQGRIDGQTGEGNVSVGFLPESEMNLKSKSGRVSIQAPARSGAYLNLLTEDGDIYVPKEVRVTRLSTEKSVRGRLRGEKQQANVVVRSQEGSIFVK